MKTIEKLQKKNVTPKQKIFMKMYLGYLNHKIHAHRNVGIEEFPGRYFEKIGESTIERLDKFHEIIENKYCDGISKNRIAFLKRLAINLSQERKGKGLSFPEQLSAIDEEYLAELRGYMDDIYNGVYPNEEEWNNLA